MTRAELAALKDEQRRDGGDRGRRQVQEAGACLQGDHLEARERIDAAQQGDDAHRGVEPA